MKKRLTQTIVLASALIITTSAFAQSPTTTTRQRRTASDVAPPAVTEKKAADVAPPAATENKVADVVQPVATENKAAELAPATATTANGNAQPQSTEEDAIVQSYNNFFSSYKLGPEDILSVTVFGQDRYSRSGIKIPPSGRISLALIPDGIFVNGKTVDQVAELIKKRYDEYIIEPQVSVSLDQAGSYRYSVIGDVGQPGIRLMTRRLSVTEAIAEAGGVLQTGDKKKVYVLRKQANGNLQPIPVNVSAIYKGQAPDSLYLNPGDQVVVPGNRWKTFDKISGFLPILSFARIFAGGF